MRQPKLEYKIDVKSEAMNKAFEEAAKSAEKLVKALQKINETEVTVRVTIVDKSKWARIEWLRKMFQI